jgi:hypothetical protein
MTIQGLGSAYNRDEQSLRHPVCNKDGQPSRRDVDTIIFHLISTQEIKAP